VKIHLNNRMFAYYDQTFDLILPITDRYIIYLRQLQDTVPHNKVALDFVLFSSFYLLLFSSPVLSRRRLDVYHTSTHGVALVRIYDAGLKRAARGSLKIQDAKNRQKFAIWAPSHNFVGLYLCN